MSLPMSLRSAFLPFAITLLATASAVRAQVPTGTIAGTIFDSSGGVVVDCAVVITNQATGTKRATATGSEGRYSAPAMAVGAYQVVVELKGFRKVTTTAVVEAGSSTTVDVTLQVGESTDSITVTAEATPQLNYENNMVQGVVRRQQIESLPLNGRDALQLAVLEPGVGVNASGYGLLNRRYYVNVMGGNQGQTRMTVDGISLVDAIDGGQQQGFSQESVQEFQVSTANPDVSFGFSAYGAVNIVSRSGGNDLHGSGYFFYRDHNMASYPAMKRDPSNPSPFFVRKQPGVSVGGPILKNRLFFFVNVERMLQVSAMRTQPGDPAFSSFAQTNQSPYNATLLSTRFDYQLDSRNNLFARYSHDGNKSFGPRNQGPLPSNWFVNKNWSDQSMLGWTSTLNRNMVNDFRFAYTYWRNDNRPPDAGLCPNCLGLGMPEINFGGGITIGNNREIPVARNERNYIFSDTFSWQVGSHRFRFGGEWNHGKAPGYYDLYNPASINTYSPTAVSQYNASVAANRRIPIPAAFTTLTDLLALPLNSFQMGVGDPLQPPPFQREKAIGNERYHVYVQDVWRVNKSLTLNFGLSLDRESNLLNYDIPKPPYLEPLLGISGLGQPPPQGWLPSPNFGFAWAPWANRKTVIRGGASIQYGTFPISLRLTDRVYEGPIGNGRVPLPGDVVPNPISGIPGVSRGTPLAFPSNPTAFQTGYLVSILPQVQIALQQTIASFGNPNSLAVRTIDVFKSAAGDSLLPNHLKVSQAQGFNLGVQHQLRANLAVTADLVWRHSIREGIGGVDLNRWQRISGPVIRPCSAAEAFSPTARCSLGSIPVYQTVGRSRYKALLVKVDKRFSKHYQFVASYALQDKAGFNGINDYENWFSSWGPHMNRHSLNLSGIVHLPLGIQLSGITAFRSRGPSTVSISGIDLTGGGINSLILPGTTNGSFNTSLHESDLPALVDQFNQGYAGKTTPKNQVIPRISLPGTYLLGANFFSQDLRIGKSFDLRHERLKLSMYGEAFNLFNNSNPGGASGNLRDANFGQFTSKTNPLFGSGGPRCFQLGARLSF